MNNGKEKSIIFDKKGAKSALFRRNETFDEMQDALHAGQSVVLSSNKHSPRPSSISLLSGVDHAEYLNKFSTGNAWLVIHDGFLTKSELLGNSASTSSGEPRQTYLGLTALKNKLQMMGPQLGGEAKVHYGTPNQQNSIYHTHIVDNQNRGQIVHYVVEWSYFDDLSFVFDKFNLHDFETLKSISKNCFQSKRASERHANEREVLHRKIQNMTTTTFDITCFTTREIELLKSILAQQHPELLSRLNLEPKKIIAFLSSGRRENYSFRQHAVSPEEKERIANSQKAQKIYRKVKDSLIRIQYKIARVNKTYSQNTAP